MTDFERWDGVAGQRAHANSQVFITVMLETAGAFEELEAIAAMDGIDAIMLGPSDFALELGISGTQEEARVVDGKRAAIIAMCRKHGKVPAMLTSGPEQARRDREAGVSMITCSSDVEILHSGFRQVSTSIRAVAG